MKSSTGVQAKLVYDELGRVISRTVSDTLRASELRYRYPANLMALTQADQITQYGFVSFAKPRQDEIVRVLQVAEYDALGRKVASGPTRERMTRAKYLGSGHLESLIAPEGEQLRWHYDAIGQVLAQVHADAKGEIKDGVMTLRDEAGVLRAMLRHQGDAVAYAYLHKILMPAPSKVKHTKPSVDDFGRRLREYHKEDGEVRYHYQENGWVQFGRSPDGKSTRQERLEFDQGGRLVLREREGCTDRLNYMGVFLMSLSGCSAVHTFNRNTIGQITEHSMQLRLDKQALKFTQEFRYQTNGDLATRTLFDGRKLHYSYDAKGHTSKVSLDDVRARRNAPRPLVEAIERAPHWLGLSALTSWRDGDGKKVTWQDASPLTPSTVAPTASATKSVPLDAWGRQTQHIPATGPNANKLLSLTWDDDNRLTQVTEQSSGALVARYRYDSFGNRVTKTTPSLTTIYLYDTRHRLIAEASPNRKILRQYIYADHRVHTVLETDQVRFIRTDWRGQPSAPGLPLRMAGQVLDDETGLYYNIHRYLDPQRWRYLSPDPLGAPDGIDRYAYLNGNPYAGIDPLGLFKVEYLGFGDPIHPEIVRKAFEKYHLKLSGPNHFSSAIIDRFVNANVLTDLSDTQFDGRNHFDNPNDTISGYNETRPGNYWIQQSIDLVNDRRQLYDDFNYVSSPGAGGLLRCKLDISEAVRSFGMNTHTLQDFYAHTNWVDPVTRGGEWEQKTALFTGVDSRGRSTYALAVKEWGRVPIGLARKETWDETVTADIFSGNAQGCLNFNCVATDFFKPSSVYGHNVEYGTDEEATAAFYFFNPRNKVVNDDKTTHAYWAKDSPEKGKSLFEAAFNLAIDHTVKEIERLYNAASLELRSAFKMNDQQLRNNVVIKQDVQLPAFPAR
jgi:RHS repeat-associated protein